MSGHIPVRTCVGCGARDPQAALLRVAVAGGALVPDLVRRAPGRGAYLHRRPECWEAFVNRRGPVRSLRLTPGRAERARLAAMLVATVGAEGAR